MSWKRLVFQLSVAVVAVLSAAQLASSYSISKKLSSKFSASPLNHESLVKSGEISSSNIGETGGSSGYGAFNSPVTLPFPQWLTDFTGLKEWPGLDPPYIPLDFVDFSKVPNHIRQHAQGQCEDPVLRDLSSCSFDCFNCVASDDAYTCPKLSQTFDDGPTPATLKLIDNLRQPSTFFTLGVQIIRFPEVYRQSVAKGHIMGSHTWSHKFLPSLTNEQIVAQLEWSIWAMNATSGHLPKWFRPPYGGIDNRVRQIVRQFGMQSVLWDFDTFDWKMLDSSQSRKEQDIYTDLKKFQFTNGGKGLMLEHDAIMRTVNVGIEINQRLLGDQLTVPQCVGALIISKDLHRRDKHR